MFVLSILCESHPIFHVLVNLLKSCVVCLYEFLDQEEIRSFIDCRHIFHRSCFNDGLTMTRKIYPFCLMRVIPEDMQEAFNERLWATYGII
ncbi:hypothetical protein MANES_05G123494v8 [Manihot esculenta]|uniref:Uncharacterized protein n=1 Tax=Manihot esculenta TaxID=3983 RepID=A0ACB7HNY2_MANES|nr:hypothetical protein MANES_05G123494v8 [Manihot esculenta]